MENEHLKIYEEMAILHHRMAQLFEKLAKPEQIQSPPKEETEATPEIEQQAPASTQTLERPVTVTDSSIPAFGSTAKNDTKAKTNDGNGPVSSNGKMATSRQLWMLHLLLKKDTREWVISKQEASDLITALKSKDQATVTRILTSNQIAAAA